MSDRPSIAARLASAARRALGALMGWATGKRSTRQVLRSALRAARFNRWGYRPISQRRLIALHSDSAALEATRHENALLRLQLAEALTLPRLPEIAQLRQQVAESQETIAHLRRMEHFDAVVGGPSRSGMQAFINLMQDVLLELPETTLASSGATTLACADQPAAEALAMLVNMNEAAQGARSFQYLLPFLSKPTPYPLAWPEGSAPLRVVDIGSQELATEGDIHAPLRAVAPVVVIGFDPFLKQEGDSAEPVEVQRPDGAVIRTYPHLIGDGGPVTFYINWFDATSSTLPTNHPVTKPFGGLNQLLETVEQRPMATRRLDDMLTDEVPIDLLKIDVQGASHVVISHAAQVLARTLVCHVEAEFTPIYAGERLFGEIDAAMRAAGFGFIDFHSLGRQRYASFEGSPRRAFHRGRTLWGDAVYLRGLDAPETLTAEELRRAALVLHSCYNKQDLAAELLGRADALAGTALQAEYLRSAT